jgi:hypothetical protein
MLTAPLEPPVRITLIIIEPAFWATGHADAPNCNAPEELLVDVALLEGPEQEIEKLEMTRRKPTEANRRNCFTDHSLYINAL